MTEANFVDSRTPEQREADSKIETVVTTSSSYDVKVNIKQPGKLIMMKGLPRSGKSTWARDFILKSGNAIIVSRDELRKMLHNGKWSHRNEARTMEAQMAIVRDALKRGVTVLIDDTNLTQHHKDRWENTAREIGARFEIHHEKEKDLHVLVGRDMKSSEPRGAHVIVRHAFENNLVHFPSDSVVLCDLDGTLCDINHRRPFLNGEKKDWKSFFEHLPGDTIHHQTLAQLLDMVSKGKKIIFVSARPEKYRDATEKWLREYGFELEYRADADWKGQTYAGLLMRADADSREDSIVKQQILDTQLQKEWVHCVFDDRPRVIRMWRANGLTVVDCGDGIEF